MVWKISHACQARGERNSENVLKATCIGYTVASLSHSSNKGNRVATELHICPKSESPHAALRSVQKQDGLQNQISHDQSG